MANDQKFLGALVEHAPIEELTVVERQYWLRNGTKLREVLAKALKCNLVDVTIAVTSRPLVLVGTVSLPATTEPFVAKSNFVVNTEHNAPVKISYFGHIFEELFLDSDGKVEDPISETTLRYHQLQKPSLNAPIINELGGEAKAETTLSEMFGLMVGQKHGEDGVLLNNGDANLFYIRDQNAVLCTVRVIWFDGGWRLSGHSVGHPDSWLTGLRVFSRN